MAHKILLIDDDPLILRSVSIILRRNGFDAVCAASVDEAMKFISDQDFDLIISDIRMIFPRKSGHNEELVLA